MFEALLDRIEAGGDSERYEVNQQGQSAPQRENEMLGEDGLLHCRVCGDPLETMISIPAMNISRKVRCSCACHAALQRAMEEKARLEEVERTKKLCFPEPEMLSWTFENDDRMNADMSKVMLEYTEKFPEFLKQKKGLLLYGPVGTGKSYYAACIANRLMEKGYQARMTSFSRLTDKLQGMFGGRQEYIDSLNDFHLLVIDDLGAERKSDSGYMQEIIYDIIDSRYLAGLPLIITTNMTAEELKFPRDIRYQRIYDRILERCHPIEVAGMSRRRQALKNTHKETKALLGL